MFRIACLDCAQEPRDAFIVVTPGSVGLMQTRLGPRAFSAEVPIRKIVTGDPLDFLGRNYDGPQPGSADACCCSKISIDHPHVYVHTTSRVA